jgi:type IV pilus assembly protein PilC
MPTFLYVARDGGGAAQTGQLDAVDEDQVAALLQHRGLLVTSITRKDLAAPVRAPTVRSAFRQTHRRVTVDDQVLLCQQLATLIDAGVPLLRSLAVVAAQAESEKLRRVLSQVQRNVEAGHSLHDALAKHPGVFSTLWLNLVQTGEASGHLAESLQQLARHFESARHLRTQALTAVTYPAVLVGVAVIVVAIFVYWLIPKFSVFFASMGTELPLLTRLVIGASNAAQRYWVGGLGLVALGAFLLSRYLRTDAGRWTRDRLLLQIPVFNALFMHVQLAEFARGLSTLLQSGVPLLTSLEILETSATNKLYGQAVRQVREAVKEGKPMTEPMAQTGVFPPMAVQMVQVGEEVGELGKMAARVAVHYEERVDAFIARLTRLFEPMAIVVMAGIVFVVVLAIFLPIFRMAGGAGLGR